MTPRTSGPLPTLLAGLLGLSILAAGCIGQAPAPAASGPGPAEPQAGGAQREAANPAENQTGSGATPAGPRADATAGNGTAGSPSTQPDSKRFDGAAAGMTDPSSYSPLIPNDKYDPTFDVRSGATAVLFEVAWSGSDKLDLYPEVANPDCTGPAAQAVAGTCLFSEAQPKPVTGASSPARVLISDPAFLKHAGAWKVAVYASSSVNDVPFKAAASVFYGGVPPDAYTALPPG